MTVRRLAVPVCSIALLLLLWQAASLLAGPDAISGPLQSADAVAAAARQGYLWSDAAVTAARLAAAFGLGFAGSLAVGIALGASAPLRRLFGLWITLGSSVPALAYVVACYLAIGVSDAAAVLAVALVVVPPTASAIADGIRAGDAGLREMGRSFGMSPRRLLLDVAVPQAVPWIFSAARACWSLSWRIMVFVELLGRPDGVGYRMQYWFNLANMPRVVASALPLVVLIVLVDSGLFRPVERRLARWRPAERS